MNRVHILLLLILLSACGQKIPSTPGALTPRPSAAAQATYTPRPKQTFTPSLTNTPSPTLGEWEMEWTATANAQGTAIVQYHLNCSPDHMVQTLTSPDEKWIASSCDYSENVFIVANRDGSKSWSVPAGHEPGQLLGNLGDTRYCESQPIHWSPDSRYVYFFLNYCMAVDFVPDYAIDMNPNSHRVLLQMDTLTGAYADFTHSANSFSFSPIGRRLICITRFGDRNGAKLASIKLTFIDLKTGGTMDFWLDNTLAAANVIWSDDGTRIFFTAEKGIPGAIFIQQQASAILKNHLTIYELDPEKSSFTLHLDLPDIEGVVYPTVFNNDNNTLILTKTLYTSGDVHELLVLDLSSHQFVIPVYTPIP